MLGYEDFKCHMLKQFEVFTPHKYQKWAPMILSEEQGNEEVEYLSYTSKSANEAAPCVCLNTAYQHFREQNDMYDAYLYAAETLAFEELVIDDLHMLGDWDFCKTRVVLKLIDSHMEKDISPYAVIRPYLELLVVYQVHFKMDGNQIQPIIITEQVLRNWGIKEDELYKVAYANTMYKASFRYANTLDLIRCRLIKDGCDTDRIKAIYDEGIKGATSYELWDNNNLSTSSILLAKLFLREIAELMGASLYLVPLENSYRAINASEIAKEKASEYIRALVGQPVETLYYYDIDTDGVSIAY